MGNFSSYVTIVTTKSVPPLTLSNSSANSGSYDPNPPQTIAPGTQGNYQLHDPSGPYGSDGSAQYAGGVFQLSVSYACPYWSGNNGYANSNGPFVVDWWGQSNDDGYWAKNSMPGRGHPIRLWVSVHAANEPPNTPF